jgi:hypothetical protein
MSSSNKSAIEISFSVEAGIFSIVFWAENWLPAYVVDVDFPSNVQLLLSYVEGFFKNFFNWKIQNNPHEFLNNGDPHY